MLLDFGIQQGNISEHTFPCQCKKCPLSFETLQGLLYHDLTHKEESKQDLSCKQCRETFNQETLRMKHIQERQCQQCRHVSIDSHGSAKTLAIDSFINLDQDLQKLLKILVKLRPVFELEKI